MKTQALVLTILAIVPTFVSGRCVGGGRAARASCEKVKEGDLACGDHVIVSHWSDDDLFIGYFVRP